MNLLSSNGSGTQTDTYRKYAQAKELLNVA